MIDFYKLSKTFYLKLRILYTVLLLFFPCSTVTDINTVIYLNMFGTKITGLI